MAYTTTTAIRTALEDVIEALNPASPAMGNDRYRKLPLDREWDDIPDAKIDRGFSVGPITLMRHAMFGVVDERDWIGDVTITLGHAKGKNLDKGMERRNEDYVQVVQAIGKKGNYPSGVSLITHTATRTVRDDKKFIVTEVDFELLFALEAP